MKQTVSFFIYPPLADKNTSKPKEFKTRSTFAARRERGKPAVGEQREASVIREAEGEGACDRERGDWDVRGMKIAVATLGERFDDRDVIKSFASVATHLAADFFDIHTNLKIFPNGTIIGDNGLFARFIPELEYNLKDQWVRK